MTIRSAHLEPRWPAMVALLAVGGLRLALPEPLSVGPAWLLIVIVGALIIPTVLARRRGNERLNQILGYLLTSLVTLDMVWSLGLLLRALPSHRETPKDLLISAASLWITNILVFASWYWRLDAGGPRARELRRVQVDGAFLFPQMTLDQQSKREMAEQRWNPGFIDYLFLAFNTSTAFSPTDTPVLSTWARVMVRYKHSSPSQPWRCSPRGQSIFFSHSYDLRFLQGSTLHRKVGAIKVCKLSL